MERISLPKRTLTTRPVLVVPIALVLMLIVLGWGAYVLYLHLADFYYMGKFRQIVFSGNRIPGTDFWGKRNDRWWTLFEEGGVMDPLRPYAERALVMDTWSGEMRYTMAHGLWREYNSMTSDYEKAVSSYETARKSTTAEALGQAGNLRDRIRKYEKELPLFRAKSILHVNSAILNDPANAFYRMTRVGLLTLDEEHPQEARQEIEGILNCHSPQNTFGQIRKAEYLVDLEIDSQRAKACYRRALELINTPVTHGLEDSTQEMSKGRWPPLVDGLMARLVLGLDGFGGYDDWIREGLLPERPEADWFLAWRLLRIDRKLEADKEFQRMGRSVEEKLALQQKVTFNKRMKEILWLPAELDYRNRYLLNREIERAAIALLLPALNYQPANLLKLEPKAEARRIADALWSDVGRKDTEHAIELINVVLKREPKKHYVRLILARLMLDRAVRLKEEANLAGARKAGELGKRGDRILDEIDEHLSVVLKDDARNAKALEIRAKASEAAGREAAKPPESGE